MNPSAPRYPIYVPSKGRAGKSHTVKLLRDDRVPFSLVLERQDVDSYREAYPGTAWYELPESERGIVYARNWIKQHAVEAGHARHWQIDDDIRAIRRLLRKGAERCSPGWALALCEDFADRYANVAALGLKHSKFRGDEPYKLNQQVYGCVLVASDRYRWRTFHEDTDYSLQVLFGGSCTVLMQAFVIDTVSMGSNAGGNKGAYDEHDGRLRRLRELKRLWPDVVNIVRRDGRPRPDIRVWHKFPQRLVKVEEQPEEAAT